MEGEQVKIYLATSGEYSDYCILHAFARREDAEAYAITHEVEEYELHEGPVETRTWHSLAWRPDQPDAEDIPDRSLGNPWEVSYPKDYDGKPNTCTHSQSGYSGMLTVQGWNIERVRKVYSEQRAKIKAQEAGF